MESVYGALVILGVVFAFFLIRVVLRGFSNEPLRADPCEGMAKSFTVPWWPKVPSVSSIALQAWPLSP
jgi:hypothetical protein